MSWTAEVPGVSDLSPDARRRPDALRFLQVVFSAFAERMQAMMLVLEKVAFKKVEARLAAWLLSRADAAGQVTATRQDMASAIGSAREVI